MLGARSHSIAELEELTGFDRRTIVYYIQQDLLPRAGRRGPNTRYPHECLLRLRFIRALKDLQDQGQSGTITLREIRRLIHSMDARALQALLERGPPAAEVEQLLADEAGPMPEAPVATAAETVAPFGQAPAAPPAGSAAPDQTAAARPAAPEPPRTVGDGRSYGLADANIRKRVAGASQQSQRPSAESGPQPPPHENLPRPAPADPGPAGAGAGGGLGELLRQLEIRPALSGQRRMPGASEHWTEIPITSRVFLSVRGLSADDAPLADSVARELKRLLRTR